MSGNGWTWLEMGEMAHNGWKQLKINGNGQKLPKMAGNG